jgi:nucleoside-diphosphate-sugar epimerase
MRVFVTGGNGTVGTATVRSLIASGHEVTVIGIEDEVPPADVTYRICDVEDSKALRDAMVGQDAVVHLAARRSPYGVPGSTVFRTNAQGTFNVYEAAAENGIVRVVNASSINVLGRYFGDRTRRVDYIPVDECHPGLITDAYSFSKTITEQTGAYFYERDGITGVSLRLPEVLTEEALRNRNREYGAKARNVALRLLALPEDERHAEVTRLQGAYDRYRQSHRPDKTNPNSDLQERQRARREFLTDEEHHYMVAHVNLYAYIHEEDSAAAIVQAVTGDYTGHHPLFINASRNSLGLPLTEVQKLFPSPLPELREPVQGDTCVPSIAAARKLLSFAPQYLLES